MADAARHTATTRAHERFSQVRRLAIWTISVFTVLLWLLVTIDGYLQVGQAGVAWTGSLIVVNTLLCGAALYLFWRELVSPPRLAEAHPLSATQQYIREHVPNPSVIRQRFRAVDNAHMVGVCREEFSKLCEEDKDNYDAIIFLCSRPLLRWQNGFSESMLKLLDSKSIVYVFLTEDGVQDFWNWDAQIQKEYDEKYTNKVVAVSITDVGPHYLPPINVAYLVKCKDGAPTVHLSFQTTTDPLVDASYFYYEIPHYKQAQSDKSLHEILSAIIRASRAMPAVYSARILRVLSEAGITEADVRAELRIV